MPGKGDIAHFQSGGQTIPPHVQTEVRKRIHEYAMEKYGTIKGLIRIDVRYKGKFCYVEAYQEPNESYRKCTFSSGKIQDERTELLRDTPSPLCRLRYFELTRWTLAVYNFCKDVYEPSVFLTGDWEGTPEEGLDMAMYIFYPK